MDTLFQRLAIATLLLAASACQAVHMAQDTAALARAQAALGWERLVADPRPVRLQGRGDLLGVPAELSLTFDSQGHFLKEARGALSQSSGFDGSEHWVLDWSGTARKLELGEIAAAEVDFAFWSGYWLSAHSPLEISPLEADHSADKAGLHFGFRHRNSNLEGTIVLDRKSLLLRSMTYASAGAEVSWAVHAWGEFEGWCYPARVSLTTNGQKEEVDYSQAARAPAAETFATRLASDRDCQYDHSLPAAIAVKRVPSGHLLVHPTVDGKDLGWFIFDSGAGINCISTQVVQLLDAEPFGRVGARGIGGTIPSQLWRVRELSLGPVRIEAPILMGLDLAFLEPHFGVPVAGIIGFEFLARCVVEFDHLRAEISLYDPQSYVLAEEGHWQEVYLYGRHPCVQASFEEHSGIFKIDTGAAGDTLTFHSPAVRAHNLLDGRETEAGLAGGVGGNVATRVGELARFVLAGHSFEKLAVEFTIEDKGAFSDPHVLGNIGGKLLEPFVLVFDYAHKRVGFKPRRAD